MNTQTKIWLRKEPIWSDSDVVKTALIGLIVGFTIGFVLCIANNII